MNSPKTLGWISFILKNLYRVLPMRSKRALYLTSLYFYLAKEGIFRNVTVNHFLRANNIEMTPNGVKLPMNAKDYIWEGTDVLNIINEEFDHCTIEGDCPPRDKAIKVSEKLIQSAPSWIKYSEHEMLQDTVRLFFLKRERSEALVERT